MIFWDTGRRLRGRSVILLMGALCLALVASGTAGAQIPLEEAEPDCFGPAPEAEFGTVEWQIRDRENAYCGFQGQLDFVRNPAFWMARAQAEAFGEPGYLGDPFREPRTRWDGVYGRYELITYPVGQTGSSRSDAAVLWPLEVPDEPLPGVMIGCHVCSLRRNPGDPWMFAAQGFVEAGYVVFMPNVSGSSQVTAALNFFLSTPDAGIREEHFPAWDQLDRERVGLMGHSGAGTDALMVGNSDERPLAVISYDRSRSFGGVTPRVPSLFLTADWISQTAAPGYTYYEPNLTSDREMEERHADVDDWREAGIDSMQVVPRASTHFDFSMGNNGCQECSRYGQRVIYHYTLAWFDRYLRGADDPVMASDALSRLTAGDVFDDSADRTSRGGGVFDLEAAQDAGDLEAGNRPIMIEGLSVADRLSFYYPSRYYLEGDTVTCGDMRAGCS